MESNSLCSQCEQADILTLFEGPRGNEHFNNEDADVSRIRKLSTLAELEAHASCPFCRLVRYAVDAAFKSGLFSMNLVQSLDPRKITCELRPKRADQNDVFEFSESNTKNAIATILVIQLRAIDRNDEEAVNLATELHPGSGTTR